MFFYLQLLKPTSRIQSTPVIVLIKKTIAKEKKTRSKPMIAKVRVDLAEATFFASPPESISFMPENIIKRSATRPARISAALTIF